MAERTHHKQDPKEHPCTREQPTWSASGKLVMPEQQRFEAWLPVSGSSLSWRLERACSRLRSTFGSTGASRSALRKFTIDRPISSGWWEVFRTWRKGLLLRMVCPSMRCW